MKLPHIPYPPTVRGYLLKQYDKLIHRLAVPTFRRITLANPAGSYFMELHIQRWNSKLQIDENVKAAVREKFETGEEQLAEEYAPRFCIIKNPIIGRYRIWDTRMGEWAGYYQVGDIESRFLWVVRYYLRKLQNRHVACELYNTWSNLEPK